MLMQVFERPDNSPSIFWSCSEPNVISTRSSRTNLGVPKALRKCQELLLAERHNFLPILLTSQPAGLIDNLVKAKLVEHSDNPIIQPLFTSECTSISRSTRWQIGPVAAET